MNPRRISRREWAVRVAGVTAAAYATQGRALASGSLRIRNHYSPRNRQRPLRPHTRYIVLHTTEGAQAGSLRKVTRRGEAHYFVCTDGLVYRIIHKSKIATHAGRSMWEGRTSIDEHAIGIEVVGFHDRDLNAAQYDALRELLRQLQSLYGIPDERVLTHSMVAYGRPNRFHPYNHRGRKRCGMIFARPDVRWRLGLTSGPTSDVDVDAGRLRVADAELQQYLFQVETAVPVAVVAAAEAPGDGGSVVPDDGSAVIPDDGGSAIQADGGPVIPGDRGPVIPGDGGTVITRRRSPWVIARDQYDSPDTLYTFPDGRQLAGNQITDWGRIPVGTRVIVRSQEEESEFEGFRVAAAHEPAQALAGEAYADGTTIYILPSGMVRTGREMTRRRTTRRLLDGLPEGTRVLVGYVYGGYVKRNRLPVRIVGRKWNYPSTFYRLPNGRILSGDEIDDSGIPSNTLVFFQR